MERKNSIIGYLTSLLFHIFLIVLIILFVHKKKDDEQTPPPPPKGQQLKLSDFNAPPPQPTPPQKQEVQKQQVKPQPQKSVKVPPKTEPMPLAKQMPKPKTERNVTQEKQAKPEPATQTAHAQQQPTHSSSGSSLLDALNTEVKKEEKQQVGAPIEKLYGKEFDQMTPAQQKFIKDNLSAIGSITQRYLRYPELAGRMNISGQNVAEFMLYPNGDITDLKLYNSSGYEILDKNSLQTIKAAYKDYPRPSQPTKIRIYVRYTIY